MVNKTFAIITDIHSNISALSEAMEIIKSRDNIDQIICLGDCFSLGPEPEKTLEKLKDIENCIFVRGNHDRYIIERLWEEELPTLEGMDPYDPICQGATGLPFDKDTRGSVAFLTIGEKTNWEVIRFDYDKEFIIDRLEKRETPFYVNLKNTVKYASIGND